MNPSKSLGWVLALAATVACQKPVDTAPTAPQNHSSPAAAASPANSSDGKAAAAGLTSPEKFEPNAVKVSFLAPPSVQPASEGSALKVPGFEIAWPSPEMESSGFVQILRCVSTIKLSSPDGVEISRLPDGPTRRDKMKYAWTEALADTNRCRLVHEKSGSTNFKDLTATSGSWVYVINPCIQRDAIKPELDGSQTECTYNLSVSEPLMGYESTLKAEFIKASQAVYTAEAALTAKYNRLYWIARTIQRNQNLCETEYAVKEAGKAAFRGLASLVLVGAGAAIGGVVSGGPAALMGAKTGLGIAMGLFGGSKPADFQCPAVDTLVAEAKAVTAQLEEGRKIVVDARNKLATIDANYAKLDELSR